MSTDAMVKRILAGLRPEVCTLVEKAEAGEDPVELCSEFATACEAVALSTLAAERSSVMTVEDYAVLAAELQCNQMRQLYGDVFLVHTGTTKELAVSEKPHDRTLTPDSSRGAGLELGRRPVFAMSFPEGVAQVGRGPSGNQLVLPYSTVSQVHALFRRTSAGTLLLCDAGSRNGTKIGNEFAPGLDQGGLPVKAGDRVKFGSVAFVVLPVEQFWELVRSLN